MSQLFGQLQTYLIPVIVGAIVLFLLRKYFRGGVFKISGINLKGKYAIITGGNTGIGEQTALELAKLGCSIIIGARDKSKSENCVKKIIKETGNSSVEYIHLDLSSKKSIEAFVSSIPFKRVDYLVNNAAVMALPTRKLTVQGFQMQYGVNHLGHFMLTSLLWNKIKKSTYFRVINVSSMAHLYVTGFTQKVALDFENINFEIGYHDFLAYSRSKLYNVLFTKALAQKIKPTQGLIATLHPGVVRTELLREKINDGLFGKILNIILMLVWPIYCIFTKSAAEGNQTTMYTLLSDDIKNGEYYADCSRSRVNEVVTKQNWDKLWKISENLTKIQFNP